MIYIYIYTRFNCILRGRCNYIFHSVGTISHAREAFMETEVTEKITQRIRNHFSSTPREEKERYDLT